MGYGHHYGPAPWYNKASREDWNCTYFHKADERGIGFDRTASGTNSLAQYAACLSYFQLFSKMPYPSGVQQPQFYLKYYKGLSFPYAPEIRIKK
jgi:hypothetical protein